MLPLQKGSKPFCKQYCCCFSTSKEAQSPLIKALVAGQCQYHTHVDYIVLKCLFLPSLLYHFLSIVFLSMCLVLVPASKSIQAPSGAKSTPCMFSHASLQKLVFLISSRIVLYPDLLYYGALVSAGCESSEGSLTIRKPRWGKQNLAENLDTYSLSF